MRPHVSSASVIKTSHEPSAIVGSRITLEVEADNDDKDLTIKDLCNRIRRKAGGNAPILEKWVIKEEQNGASAQTEVGYNL